MASHAIRLASAWEPPSSGSRTWRRRFGKPTGIGPGDRIILACEGAVSAVTWGEAMLNGRALVWQGTADGAIACDVTELLDRRNLLEVPGAADDSATPRGGTRVPLPSSWGSPTLLVVSH